MVGGSNLGTKKKWIISKTVQTTSMQFCFCKH